MHRKAMDHGMHFDPWLDSIPTFSASPALPVRARDTDSETTNSHGCCLNFAMDPDESRVRGTHSLAENGHRLSVADGPDFLDLIGHAPAQVQPWLINVAGCTG
jgi:hypothetical protein